MDASASRRVLLVEDNPGDAELVAAYLAELRPPNHQVHHAERLTDALELLRSRQPEVVLLDLQLPDAAGLECVLELRRRSTSVPIIVLTGLEDEALALECIAAGAQDYLAKAELHTRGLGRAIAYAVARAGEVSERARADALQARLAAIVDASADAILSIALDRSVTSWNRGAERLFGFAAHEAIGHAVHELIALAEGDRPAVDDWLLVAPEGMQTDSVVREVRCSRRDGSAMTLTVTTSVLRDADGRVTDLALICRDVTEAKRRDEALRHSHAELLANHRQMRALAARLNAVREQERTRISREVHDELGQLLTGLKMDLRWLLRRIGPKSVPPQILLDKLGETEHLVDQTIATVQRIAVELRPSVLDSLGLAAAVRDEARRFEARSGVQASVEVGARTTPPPEVATALFRILQELLTNAARHAGARALCIELDEDTEHWLLRVRDDGVGIDAAAVARTESLGLLGMSERAAAIGGHFDVRPNSGGGTVATVLVPRRAATAP